MRCGRPLTPHLSQAVVPGDASRMRRRTLPEPLKPTHEPRWLVVRDSINQALKSTQIPPNANLRNVLEAARAERIADGWTAESIGRCVAFFFCSRDGERLMVAIEH